MARGLPAYQPKGPPSNRIEGERTTLLVRHCKDRRDEERQAKCQCGSEWCRMHPREQCSSSGEYEIVTNTCLLFVVGS